MERIKKEEFMEEMEILIAKSRADIDIAYHNISDNIHEAFFDIEMLKNYCEIHNKNVAQISSAKNLTEKEVIFYISNEKVPMYAPINEFADGYQVDIQMSITEDLNDDFKGYQ